MGCLQLYIIQLAQEAAEEEDEEFAFKNSREEREEEEQYGKHFDTSWPPDHIPECVTPLYLSSIGPEHVTSMTRRENDIAFRLVADHVRTAQVVKPYGAWKSGPGLVVRTLIRRAEWRAHLLLKLPKFSLHRIARVVNETLKSAYPEIARGLLRPGWMKEEEAK